MTPRETARFGSGVGLVGAALVIAAFVGVFGEDVLMYVALTGDQFISAELGFDVAIADLASFGWFLGLLGAAFVVAAIGRLLAS